MIGLCIFCACTSYALSFFPGTEMVRMLLLMLIIFCTLWSFLQTLANMRDGNFEHLISFIAGSASMFLATKQLPGEDIINLILIFACGAGIISAVIYSIK